MRPLIDYSLVEKAIEHYKEYMYEQIEVPWIVDEKIDEITRPNDKRTIFVKKKKRNNNGTMFLGHMCASGEQGLIQLALEGSLKENNPYVTVTPCFRDDKEDELHSSDFLKVELGVLTRSRSDAKLFRTVLVRDASYFFESLLQRLVQYVRDEDTIDVQFDGVEIGSYGFREIKQKDMPDVFWVYGTGLALPRFSTIMRRPRSSP